MCHPSWGRALAMALRLRRVRDRIDREHGQPLNVAALARDVSMPAGQLCAEFRLAYGTSPYEYLMARRAEHATATRPVRNREALVAAPDLA